MARWLFMFGSVALIAGVFYFIDRSTGGLMSMPQEKTNNSGEGFEVTKTDQEWRELLSDEQYYVCRQEGTERAFSGEYWDNKEEGVYHCVGCDNDLFTSATKFESGTGWPSYWKPIGEDKVETREDRKWFMNRTEVHCRRCGSHLGHVFDDGPQPTGKRYCLNSAALKFKAAEE